MSSELSAECSRPMKTISEEFSVTNFFLHKSNFGMFKAACLFKRKFVSCKLKT